MNLFTNKNEIIVLIILITPDNKIKDRIPFLKINNNRTTQIKLSELVNIIIQLSSLILCFPKSIPAK